MTLNLRHHKHTGKLLAHKHTSYRILFLLMLVPIIAMALVDQMAKASDDIVVSAKIPLSIPSGPPVITNPTNNETIHSKNITIDGTCPVVNQAVVVAIYDGDTLIGSAQCTSKGKFSVPATVSLGMHKIVATVVTITGDIGASSQPVTFFYSEVNSFSAITTPSFGTPVHIVASDRYVLMDSTGNATWHGSFAGGLPVYTVRVEWGDGSSDTYGVADQTEQAFSHHYKSIGSYKIIVQVTDANGDISTLYSAAVTLALQQRVGFDTNMQTTTPILAFIQKYIWQIYIGTFSSLVFLWYLEHGRHLLNINKRPGHLHSHR